MNQNLLTFATCQSDVIVNLGSVEQSPFVTLLSQVIISMITCGLVLFVRRCFRSTRRVGSITVADDAEKIAYGLKSKAAKHPHHIVCCDYTETFGGSKLSWKVYWMPTYGHCSKMAAAFHYMTTYQWKYNGDSNIFSTVVNMIQEPYFGKFDDYEEPKELVESVAARIEVCWGLAKEKREIEFSKCLKQYAEWGVPLGAPGAEGVVFTEVNGVVHCGYKCHYEKPVKGMKLPKSWCARTLLKTCLDKVKKKMPLPIISEFMFDYRTCYGGNDSYVELAEFQSYMNSTSLSYNLYRFDESQQKIVDLVSNCKYAQNALVWGLLKDEHWDFYRPDAHPGCTDYSVKSLEAPTGKISRSESSSTRSTDLVDKEKDATPKEVTRILNIPTEVLIPGAWPADDKFVVLADYRKVYKLYGQKYYNNGEALVHCKNSSEKRAFCKSRDGVNAQYLGRDWIILDSIENDGVTYVELVQDVRATRTDYDELGFPYTYQIQADPSAEADLHIREFCLVGGKLGEMKRDLVSQISAAELYVGTATHKPMSTDWITYRLIRFLREKDSQGVELKHVASGEFWRRKFDIPWKTWLLRGIVGLYYSFWFRLLLLLGSRSWISIILLLLGIDIPVIVYSYLSLEWFVVLSMFLYFANRGPTYRGANVGRLNQELSWEKVSELWSKVNLQTVSLNTVKCFWFGKSVSFETLLKTSLHMKKPVKEAAVSKLVPCEWEKSLHRIAPASVAAGLWAFLARASTPLAVP